MSPLLPLVSIAQLSLTTYTLYLSSLAIPKLLSYEDKAKTASKYSNIAEEQLFKTRATQAASVGSVLKDLLLECEMNTANTTQKLLLTLLSTSSILFTSTPRSTTLALAGVNIVVLLGVREYVGNFWNSKPKVPLPGTGDYNDAVGLTGKIRERQVWLAAGWGVMGVVAML
ncbi:methyltransferase domain-containing protein [Rutstroemia sp. NJR-2017a WRK4]|nr:methyltransferase domain-containing protein [Rutstroemia sp. NJR-2017a WRK4]